MKISPMGDLIAVRDLPEETLKMMGANLVQSVSLPSPGWFVGEVVAVSSRIAKETGLKQGDRCLIQDMSQPYGAGWLPSEEFGLPAGGRVVLVPVRTVSSPERSEELVERRKEMLKIERNHPVEKYPLPAWHTGREEDGEGHKFWNTDVGKGLLAQLREHIVQVQQIMRSRKGKGRNRLLKPVDEAEWCRSAPEGILAVLEPDDVVVPVGRNDGPTRNRPYAKQANGPDVCPKCGSPNFVAWYAGFDRECIACGHKWESGSGNIRVLTEEESRAKRPELYPPSDDEPDSAWNAWLKVVALKFRKGTAVIVTRDTPIKRKGVKKTLSKWIEELA